MGSRLFEGITTGTGADLDVIGRLIGLPRDSIILNKGLDIRLETDEEYRIHLLIAYKESFDGT